MLSFLLYNEFHSVSINRKRFLFVLTLYNLSLFFDSTASFNCYSHQLEHCLSCYIPINFPHSQLKSFLISFIMHFTDNTMFTGGKNDNGSVSWQLQASCHDSSPWLSPETVRRMAPSRWATALNIRTSSYICSTLLSPKITRQIWAVRIMENKWVCIPETCHTINVRRQENWEYCSALNNTHVSLCSTTSSLRQQFKRLLKKNILRNFPKNVL